MLSKNIDFASIIKRGSVTALVPARGGSKGVPGKNIRNLGGYPVIAYSIEAALLSERIDRVIVSTDSEEIAEISRKYGAEAPFLRPSEFASDRSGDIEFVEHFLNYMAENEGAIPEFIVHLRPTTPIREISVMDEAIDACIRDRECCSLRSAHKASESPYKWFLRTDEGFFRPMAEGRSNEEINGGRQGFPDVYIPDGYVDVLKTEYILNTGTLHGEKMLAFESPVCYEIDTLDDLELIEFQIGRQSCALYDHLKQKHEREYA